MERENWNGPRKDNPVTWPAWLRALARAILAEAEKIQFVQIEQATAVTQGESYEYDAAGSMSRSHSYDAGAETSLADYVNNDDSRLAAIEGPDVMFGDYVYDHLGQRVLKSDLGLIIFVYDVFGNMIGEYYTDHSFRNEFIYLGGTRLAMVSNESGGGGGGGGFPGCNWQPPTDPIDCGIGGAFQAAAYNWVFIAIGPILIGLGFRFRKNKKILLCAFALSSGIIIFMISRSANPQLPASDSSSLTTNYQLLTTNEAVYYYHNDHLGTPQKLTDDSGAIVWDAVYEPFGAISALTSSVDNNFRFPGQYEDETTGMYYNYHRYYMSGLGRYNRSDPLISIITNNVDYLPALSSFNNILVSVLTNMQIRCINSYAYGENNPIILIDFRGLAAAQRTELHCQEVCRVAWQMCKAVCDGMGFYGKRACKGLCTQTYTCCFNNCIGCEDCSPNSCNQNNWKPCLKVAK